MPYVKYTDFNYKLEVPKQLKQPQQFTVVLKRLCQYLLFVCLSIIETSHNEIYFFPGFAKKKKKKIPGVSYHERENYHVYYVATYQ